MANRDAVAANDDLLDEQPDDALALGHIQGLRPVAKACEKLVQRVRQPQVRGLIGQLRGEGLLLGLQARLALAQLRHAPPQLVQVEQTFLVGREQSLDASLRLQQLAFDPILMALGRIGSACSLEAACELGLDQHRVFEQAYHLVPHRLLQQVKTDGLGRAARLPLVAPCIRTQAAVVVDLARAAARGGAIQRVAAFCAVHQALQHAGFNGAARSQFLVVLQLLLRQFERALVHQCGHGDLDPLVPRRLLLRAWPSPWRVGALAHHAAAATLPRGFLCLAEAGHAAVGRVAQHGPDG